MPLKPAVIGLIGLAQAGKTTLARHLYERTEFEGKARVYSFADPIRRAINTLGVHKAVNPALYRELAQQVGEIVRESDPDHFVNEARAGLRSDEMRQFTVIFDDVRFENEVTMLRQLAFDTNRRCLIVLLDPLVRFPIDHFEAPMYQHVSEFMARKLTAGASYPDRPLVDFVLPSNTMTDLQSNITAIIDALSLRNSER